MLSSPNGRRAGDEGRQGEGASSRPRRKSSEDGLDAIAVRGARQHNLKGIDLDIPRDKMTVCSGPSGSGKSSLAIDTLYAEGQRRYVESLSSYARQFLAPLQKPKVERISGLSPAISIEQKTTSKSPRSTVGTVTEIYDYLRILFARLGQPYCPKCGMPIGTQTADEIVEKVLHLPEGTKVYVMAPSSGATARRTRRSGTSCGPRASPGCGSTASRSASTSPPSSSHRRKHKIEVVVDRAVVRRSTRSRLADSVESALDLGKGVVHVARVGDEADEPSWHVDRYSQHRVCDRCGRSFDELSPHHFSFNSPLGWCPVCEGLGIQHGANPAVLVPDGRLSLREGAVAVWPDFDANPALRPDDRGPRPRPRGSTWTRRSTTSTAAHRRIILHGAGETWYHAVPARGDGQPGFSFQYKGLFPAIEEAGARLVRLSLQAPGDGRRRPLRGCMGARLRDDAAAVRFHGLHARPDQPLAARPGPGVLQGAEARCRRAAHRRRPACARSATG